MLRQLLSVVTLFVLVPLACVSEDPGPPTQITCDEYCAMVQKNCTGASAQYRSADECKRACGMLDLGVLSDDNKDTIGCRYNHALTAATSTSLAECVAAGPFGGGVCGDRCTPFCRIVQKACIERPEVADKPFASAGDCLENCPTFDPAQLESPPDAVPGGDTLNCRERHLILAIEEPNPHCAHAGRVSSMCTNAK